jgi:hypothetical protein
VNRQASVCLAILIWTMAVPRCTAICNSHAPSGRGGYVVTASHLTLPRPQENVAMDFPTLLCIDDRPQVLELRKATLESQRYCVKLASSGYTR